MYKEKKATKIEIVATVSIFLMVAFGLCYLFVAELAR
jgi:hypothetical protein